MTEFSDLPLYQPFVKTLVADGITEPTPVQEKVMPLALEGKSVFFESETGTGKTFAFLLPLLTRLMQDEQKSTAPRILILRKACRNYRNTGAHFRFNRAKETQAARNKGCSN